MPMNKMAVIIAAIVINMINLDYLFAAQSLNSTTYRSVDSIILAI